MVGLVLIAFSAGVLQAAVYAGVKQNTTPATAAIGFSLLYALMVPLSYIGITLVYRRLKHETIIEPFMLTRERDAKKAAESEALRDEASQQIAKA